MLRLARQDQNVELEKCCHRVKLRTAGNESRKQGSVSQRPEIAKGPRGIIVIDLEHQPITRPGGANDSEKPITVAQTLHAKGTVTISSWPTPYSPRLILVTSDLTQ